MHPARTKADAFRLKHVEGAGKVGHHRVHRRVAGAFPFAQGSSREARAARQIFHGEIGKRTASAQLVAGDSNCQHGKDSAPIGKAAKTNKDSHCEVGEGEGSQENNFWA